MALQRGVKFIEHCAVQGFRKEHGQAVALETEQGEIPADHVVMATGVFTPSFGKELGCQIPIQPGKGYSMTMKHPKTCPKISMLFQEDRVACTPMQSAYRLGSMMEFAGFNESKPAARYEVLRTGAAKYLVDPYTDDIEEQWFGWRPMAYDGRPFIDRSPAMKNVWIAAGHSMLGLTLAPATGKLVSELVAGIPPHVDPRPYQLKDRIGLRHAGAMKWEAAPSAPVGSHQTNVTG